MFAEIISTPSPPQLYKTDGKGNFIQQNNAYFLDHSNQQNIGALLNIKHDVVV